MNKKIEKLTPEQEAQFPEYVKKWTQVGLTTEPANRPLAEEGIKLAYKIAGLKEPKIIWCQSPMEMVLVRGVALDLEAEAKKQGVKNNVWNNVRNNVENNVGNNVRNNVENNVGNNVWNNVGNNVENNVGNNVGNNVRNNVRNNVWNNVWNKENYNLSGCIYGHHEAGWISYYSFFRNVCGLKEETEQLQGLTQVTENAGWYFPHENICFISERYNVLNLDSQGRLHCEDGPAVSYPDGYSIFAINGVLVPEYVVMEPGKITVSDIEKETNSEIKRIKISRYGTSRYLQDSGAQQIHKDQYGILYSKDILNDEKLVMVQVLNSTSEVSGNMSRDEAMELFGGDVTVCVGSQTEQSEDPSFSLLKDASPELRFKDYFIRVPPSMSRAKEAVAWTFGKTEEEYCPLVET